MKMNTEHINILLQKYWDCQTSVSEERELHDFFSTGSVPEEMKEYIPLFTYRENQRLLSVSDEFDTKLNTAISKQNKAQQYITIRIFTPLLRIVASLILIGGLGVSLYFIGKQNNKPHFSETYNDPNAAFKQAAFALDKLSHALRVSEEASVQKLQEIENLDFDWTALDSLTTMKESLQTESPKTEEAL